MTISFSCPSCNARRHAAAALVGRHVRCPKCDSIVEVPAKSHSLTTDEAKEPAEDLVVLELVDVSLASDSASHRSALSGTGLTSMSGPPITVSLVEHPPDEPVSLRRKMNRDDTEMDMTPMVDVVFQLLIFFMLTAAFALQKSKEVPKPSEESDQPSTQVQVTSEPQDNPDYITVKIDSQNMFRVTTVDWDEEAGNEHELFVKLRRAKLGDAAGHIPTKMIVQIHEEALQDKLIAALDGGSAIEISEVEISTVSVDE